MSEPRDGMADGRTVRVSVTLKGTLAGHLPGGRAEMDVARGTAVGGLIEVLRLPRSSYLFVVNGAMVDRDALLSEGNHVQIHPPMAGG